MLACRKDTRWASDQNSIIARDSRSDCARRFMYMRLARLRFSENPGSIHHPVFTLHRNTTNHTTNQPTNQQRAAAIIGSNFVRHNHTTRPRNDVTTIQ